MFSKLAFNNVKKSIRDYTVYFLTLTFGICIFYVFNSLDSQRAMLDISQAQSQMLQRLAEIIGFVSVFVSIILGFLIIYANKFLIKRRKKELGLYMILGMEKGRISRVFILETLIIGFLSLIIGLISGVFLSHGFSVITANLFSVNMKEFTFVFSKSAFIKSLIYFGLIYLIVMVFNTIVISKYKLIDLINAGKKNETVKVKKLGVSVVVFIISLFFLILSYWAIIDNGLMSIDAQFYSAFVLCFIGTFLFFFSLSGFLLRIVQSNKNIYYKNLNMFILRQLNSKINTAFISMTFICLMLAVTIVSLCSGMALSDAFTKELNYLTPFDISMTRIEDKTTRDKGIAERLKEDGIEFDKIFKEYTETEYFLTDIKFKELIGDKESQITNPYFKEYLQKNSIQAISLSDFNSLLGILGEEEIALKDNQYALNCNVSELINIFNYHLNSGKELKIYGNSLVPLSKEVMTLSIVNQNMRDDNGTLILPDDMLRDIPIHASILNANYNASGNKYEELFEDELNKTYNEETAKPFSWKSSRLSISEQSKGLSTTMTYITIYIGIVFVITSAAVLALQQLSEASDNIERYALLSKLGTDDEMIKKSLFAQILIYFITPLLLALVHSVIGIYVSSQVIKQFGKMYILPNILMTAALFVLVYGGYFIATYLSSRNIIRPRKNN